MALNGCPEVLVFGSFQGGLSGWMLALAGEWVSVNSLWWSATSEQPKRLKKKAKVPLHTSLKWKRLLLFTKPCEKTDLILPPFFSISISVSTLCCASSKRERYSLSCYTTSATVTLECPFKTLTQKKMGPIRSTSIPKLLLSGTWKYFNSSSSSSSS